MQYTDDASLFLKNSKDMKEAIEILEKVGRIAGVDLNLNNCEGLWISSSKNRQSSCMLYDIKWPKEVIRCLGIYIVHNLNECKKLNFVHKLHNIDNVLKLAERRTFTLFGKVCILKSIALSTILYTAMCLTVPDKMIEKIDGRIFRSLWEKPERIKRKSVMNKLEMGGLNMVNVQAQISALRAA